MIGNQCALRAVSAVFIFGFAFSNASLISADQGSLAEPELRGILSKKCQEVNDFYKNEHFPIPAPSPDACILLFKVNDDYKEKVGVFQPTEQALVGAQVLDTSGKIIEFTNNAASHLFFKSPLANNIPPPTWTPNHAIEVASKFASLFLGSWNVHLSKPIVEFTWPTKIQNRAAPGQWTVTWDRVSRSGVRLFGDAVVVDESEQYGPQAISIFLALKDAEEEFTPIPKGKALTEARKGLDNILQWKSAQHWLPESEVQGQPEGPWLMIIRPNLDLKGDFEKYPSSSLDTRLAWLVTYHVQSKSNANASGNVTVYIDAKDGTFLGGYF